jgi:hypothetical protein
MAWKLAEAALMSFCVEQHCDALPTAQDQLKQQLLLMPI